MLVVDVHSVFDLIGYKELMLSILLHSLQYCKAHILLLTEPLRSEQFE